MMYREYMILFQILDYCFKKGVCDDLPALLGEMSPYIFSDFMPADRMVYDDWAIRCRKLKTSLDWKFAIISLLEEYENEYHFCFDDTKDILNEMTESEFEVFISSGF